VKLLGAVLAVVLACATAQAADNNNNFQILGAGALTCQKYLDASKQDRLYAETWWAGYATAANRLTDDTWSVIGKKSIDDVNGMLQKECGAHPDDLIAIAVHSVLEDLYKTRTTASPNK
jgi:hypothetical protein